MAICLGWDADLHMAQLMPLPLTIFCSSKSRLVLSSSFYLSGTGSPSGSPRQMVVVVVVVWWMILSLCQTGKPLHSTVMCCDLVPSCTIILRCTSQQSRDRWWWRHWGAEKRTIYSNRRHSANIAVAEWQIHYRPVHTQDIPFGKVCCIVHFICLSYLCFY